MKFIIHGAAGQPKKVWLLPLLNSFPNTLNLCSLFSELPLPETEHANYQPKGKFQKDQTPTMTYIREPVNAPKENLPDTKKVIYRNAINGKFVLENPDLNFPHPVLLLYIFFYYYLFRFSQQ